MISQNWGCFKICLLWLLHDKECCCTEMRWMFIISTAIWVTGSDTSSVSSRSELTSSKCEWTRIWTIYNVDEMNLYTSCIAKYVSQSELKCFMKLQVIYLWQEQAFFWFLPGNRINHSTKSMPTLHSIVLLTENCTKHGVHSFYFVLWSHLLWIVG